MEATIEIQWSFVTINNTESLETKQIGLWWIDKTCGRYGEQFIHVCSNLTLIYGHEDSHAWSPWHEA